MSLMITCPICGKRAGYEFRFGNETRGPRPAEKPDLTPEEWADYTHFRDNAAGIQTEWWYHRDGCQTWFTIRRDTVTNREVK